MNYSKIAKRIEHSVKTGYLPPQTLTVGNRERLLEKPYSGTF